MGIENYNREAGAGSTATLEAVATELDTGLRNFGELLESSGGITTLSKEEQERISELQSQLALKMKGANARMASIGLSFAGVFATTAGLASLDFLSQSVGPLPKETLMEMAALGLADAAAFVWFLRQLHR
ncbi:hypothetical protein EXS57_00385 [Candidatus Kaiserbacteria bacterium]|nr:hypothetical protein [Candidatus Kaiserbacteria bacterium]